MSCRSLLVPLLVAVSLTVAHAQPPVEVSLARQTAFLLQSNKYADAVVLCTKHLGTDPEDARLGLETIITTATAKGQSAMVTKLFSDWVQQEPQNATACAWLGTVLSAQPGLESEAEKDYRHAIEIDARCADALYGLTALYQRRGDDRAEAEWNAFLQTEPDGPRATAVRRGWAAIASRLVAGTTQFQRYPSWSPDGKRVVYWGNADWAVHVREPDGNIFTLTEGKTKDFTDMWPVWSPDGGTIAFGRGVKLLRSAATGIDWAGDRKLFPLAPAIFQTPQFSVDGKRLAGDQAGSSMIPVVEMETKQLTTLHAVSPDPKTEIFLYQPCWSPDGKKIVCSGVRRVDGHIGKDRPIGLFEAKDGAMLRWIRDNDSANTYPRYSPDGHSIVFCSNEGGTEYHVWIMSATEPFEAQLLDFSALPYPFIADWSPDGRQLITESPDGWRILTLGGLDTHPVKLTTKPQLGGLTVTVANRRDAAVTVNVAYRLFDANSVQITERSVGKPDMPLQKGEVIDCPLSLDAVKQPGTYTVKLTAVTDKGERVVELVDYEVK